jgi:hypothetical protein
LLIIGRLEGCSADANTVALCALDSALHANQGCSSWHRRGKDAATQADKALAANLEGVSTLLPRHLAPAPLLPDDLSLEWLMLALRAGWRT